MGKDYAKAEWLPVSNFWPGRRGNTRPLVVVIHGTASGAPQTARQMGLNEFNDTNSNASTHYGVDKDGTVVQFVSEADTAWGNCCVTDGPGGPHDPHFIKGENQNPRSISIEHMKYATDNSDAITPAQKQASFELIYDICKRNNIPMQWVGANGGICYHASIDMAFREHCPGPYPKEELIAYCQARALAERNPINVKLSHTGEVREFDQADQFQPHKSQFECGFFAVAIVQASSPVGVTPHMSADQIITQAEQDYLNLYGSNDISMMWGMSVQQEYNLVAAHGMGYWGIPLDDVQNRARAWLRAGYPLIAAVAETSVYDLDLGSNPYPWTPSGNHIIVLSGLSGNDFLVRDSANCTNLYDPNSLRPGPRRYSADRLAFVSLTAIIPHDMKMPQAGFDPRKDTLNVLPKNWKQSGDIITAPNGIHVKAGFAKHILTHQWAEDDVPLEEEHLMNIPPYNSMYLGTDGSGQCFARHYLRWTPAAGVYEDKVGAILDLYMKRAHNSDALRQEDEAKLADATKKIQDFQNQIEVLKHDLELAKSSVPSPALPVTPAPVVVTSPVVEAPVLSVPADTQKAQLDAMQAELQSMLEKIQALQNKKA